MGSKTTGMRDQVLDQTYRNGYAAGWLDGHRAATLPGWWERAVRKVRGGRQV